MISEQIEQAYSGVYQFFSSITTIDEKAGPAMVEIISHNNDSFILLFSIFVLSIFVGYYVVWSVTPALHTPLMSLTNAISSIIIVGAIFAVGLSSSLLASIFGFIAIVLASINIFGGFFVTWRMLAMYKKKK